MKLSALDWIVIGLYFLINLGVGLYYARRARGSTSEFFLSGRGAPWWLAGTSMVATTFAADTPLAVTALVIQKGVAGNWLWWCLAFSGMLTVFFFARLWRRSNVLTDVELAQMRYSGRPAAFLRGFRALYLGVPINCVILGWVNLAMVAILQQTLGVTERWAVVILLGILAFTAFYTTLAGLWGVLVTDSLQFVLMMTMVVLLAVYAVDAVGGVEALKTKIAAIDASSGFQGSRLDFFPPLDSVWFPAIVMGTYLGVVWWSSWYPSAEPGGGGYIAQRIFSAKDERHGVLATLYFNVANYALRPWPWILTGLAALALHPELAGAKPEDMGNSYIDMFMDGAVFPPALRGLMIAGFAAAYMSTISTQLNWGASYIMNDFYRPFVKPGASERHYVVVSQVCTVLIMFASIGAYTLMDSIVGAWTLLLVASAGTGAVYILRWYWWRINAWSEVTAMLVAAATAVYLQFGPLQWNGESAEHPEQFAYLMLTNVAVTTVAWVLVTFLTRPEPQATLLAFYRRVQPAGPGWKAIRALAPDAPAPTERLGEQFLNWLLGCMLVYASVFGIGYLVLKEWTPGLVLVAVALVAGGIISFNLSRALAREGNSSAAN